jgi:hypothetical protein
MEDLNCSTYNINPLDLFVPPVIAFQTMCTSFDRTELFIISLIRLSFYVLILVVMRNIFDLDNNPTIKNTIYFIIIVNIVYIGIVTSKKTIINMGKHNTVAQYRNDKEKEEEIPFQLKEEFVNLEN